MKKLLIARMCIVCNKNVDFGDQKRKWTDPGVNNNNNPMSASIYSVDNLCKRFGQNKLQQIDSLICPYMNSNHLFFDAFVEVF